MACPLCGQRKARRTCPGIGCQICPVCCGTKRLTEIRCPPGCVYLASAREHPAATVVRQRQRDVSLLMDTVRDLNQRQAELFLIVSTFLTRYRAPALQPLIDDDVADAAASMAATHETAARGVIYDHRPASLPAERLVAALKPLLVEAGQTAGSAFERDAAVVLRKVADAAGRARALDPVNRRAFLDVLGRTMRDGHDSPESPEPAAAAPRLILP